MGREIRSKYRITHTYIQRMHYKSPFAQDRLSCLNTCGLLVYVMPYPRAAIILSLVS